MTGGSVGQHLKQARTELQLTLKDVTQATKIQPWVLEALEGDRLHTTMSPIYVKSFLATYARFLRLDPTPFVAKLFPPPSPAVQRELPSPAPKPVRAPKPPKPARAPKPPRPAFVMPSVKLPDIKLPELKMPDIKMPDLSGVADTVERWMPALRRVGVLAAGAGAVAALVVVNPLRHLPSIRPKQASLAIAPQKAAATPKAAALNLKPDVPLELTLAARKPSWISIKSDGQLIAQQRLESGANESWKAKQRFELIIAEPAQIDVTLNGRSITPLTLAHRGRVIITHAAVKALAPSPSSTAQKSAVEAKPAQTAAAPALASQAATGATAASAPAAAAKPTEAQVKPAAASSSSAKPAAASAKPTTKRTSAASRASRQPQSR